MSTSIWEKTIKQALSCLRACTNKDKKYLIVANCFQQNIQTGLIELNTPLPAQRYLAKELHLTLATINRIYQHLALQNIIRSQPGKGSFTCYPSSDLNANSSEQSNPIQIDTRMMRAISIQAELLTRDSNTDLEQTLTNWMNSLQLPIKGRDVQLTHSIFEAINLCFSRLLNINEVVLCMNLTQAGLAQIASQKEITLKPLSFKGDQIEINVLEQYCKIYQPKALFIHSHIHCPTGQVLTSKQKREIAQVCLRYKVYVIEDVSSNWLDQPKLSFTDLLPEMTFCISSITSLANLSTHYCALQYPAHFDFEFRNMIQSASVVDPFNALSLLNPLLNNKHYIYQWRAKHKQLTEFVNNLFNQQLPTLLKMKNDISIYLGSIWINCDSDEQSEQLKMILAQHDVICLTQEIFLFDFQPQWLKPVNNRSPSGVRLCFAHLPLAGVELLFSKIEQSLFQLQSSAYHHKYQQKQPLPLHTS